MKWYDSLYQSSAPSATAVSVTEAKAHMRVDIADDDTYIGVLIDAATDYIERFTRRQLVTATWVARADKFPDSKTLIMPKAPLATVTSITYYDADGNSQTYSSANYQVDIYRQPGRIVLASTASWPTVQSDKVNAVTVTFTAGYGAASAVPKAIKQAMLILVSHWYENREPIVTGTIVAPVPMSAESLLWKYRLVDFA